MFSSAEEFQNHDDFDAACCVVLDINLNTESGIELRHRLKAAGISLPVIYITANDNPAVRMAAMESGCIAYLTKPFPAKSLIEPIEKASADGGIGCSTSRRWHHSSIVCSKVCAGVPCRTAANWLSGNEVLTVNTLESTTSSRSFLPVSISLINFGSARSAAMQVLVRHQT